MAAINKVGLIGLGAMGNPMARHLRAKGFGVCGFDVSEAAVGKARAAGIDVKASPTEVARASELVIIVVGFDSDVERAFFNKDGLLEGGHDGLIVAVGSTISPSYARELEGRIAGTGISLIDMPLTRGEWAAEAAEMLVMGGGDSATFERCRPAFETFASDIFHLGPFGAGQVGKMVNNLILWACISANDEGFRLADKMNVDRETLRTALLASSGTNWAMHTRVEDKPMPWAEKDLLIVLSEADKAKMPVPLSALVREMMKDFKARMGYPTPDAPK